MYKDISIFYLRVPIKKHSSIKISVFLFVGSFIIQLINILHLKVPLLLPTSDKYPWPSNIYITDNVRFFPDKNILKLGYLEIVAPSPRNQIPRFLPLFKSDKICP